MEAEPSVWDRDGGPDITLNSGALVWFTNPWRTPILQADFFFHASLLRRYNCAYDITLLQHLALCTMLARELGMTAEVLELCALHDIHEYIVGDLPTAMKKLLPNWKPDIEDPWEYRVHQAFGLRPAEKGTPQAKDVKAVDRLALALEMRHAGHRYADYVSGPMIEALGNTFFDNLAGRASRLLDHENRTPGTGYNHGLLGSVLNSIRPESLAAAGWSCLS